MSTLSGSARLTEADWQSGAVCRGADPDVFFPAADADAAQAKAICAGCGVRIDCLAFAMASDQRHGVWGGLSEKDRAALRSRGRRSAQSR